MVLLAASPTVNSLMKPYALVMHVIPLEDVMIWIIVATHVSVRPHVSARNYAVTLAITSRTALTFMQTAIFIMELRSPAPWKAPL